MSFCIRNFICSTRTFLYDCHTATHLYDALRKYCAYCSACMPCTLLYMASSRLESEKNVLRATASGSAGVVKKEKGGPPLPSPRRWRRWRVGGRTPRPPPRQLEHWLVARRVPWLIRYARYCWFIFVMPCQSLGQLLDLAAADGLGSWDDRRSEAVRERLSTNFAGWFSKTVVRPLLFYAASELRHREQITLTTPWWVLFKIIRYRSFMCLWQRPLYSIALCCYKYT